MIRKGPASDYLVEPHSVRYLRSEFFMPELANRRKREQQEPGDDMLSKAKAKVQEIRLMEPESRLADDVRAMILERFAEIR
jgi:trimethylamine--corrinoid protein Co-methyltransferase